jgi:osmoprotectant transport system ATP-binding protein
MVNRMVSPASGRVLLEGRDVRTEDPIALRRRIGYVIQDVGLLPHWTVGENAGLVPTLERWPTDRKAARVTELLEQVGLPQETFAGRYPHELSGGQRQRVGVARALANESKLLLFDEPFGALDPITRHEMQQQFLALRNRYEIASLFVTHDVAEALALGTRVGLLENGKLALLAAPEEFRKSSLASARRFLDTLPAWQDQTK